MITIRSVDADGKLDASYANPRPLPFHTAVASKDGDVLKLSFELRAGGYNGSTYKLRYDAANDRLTGFTIRSSPNRHSTSSYRNGAYCVRLAWTAIEPAMAGHRLLLGERTVR